MTDKQHPDESDNPFEDLQRQLRDLFKGAQVNVTASPFGTPPGRPADSGEAEGGGDQPVPEPGALERIRAFNLKPKEIRDYLNRFVIGQEAAKKVLAVAICDHYNHVRRTHADPQFDGTDYSKQNILLLGPTGVGKTYLMKNIARLIGVPFVKADATKFSETGYVGSDVEDLVRDLVRAANGDTELAEYGIIFVDEIDKIASLGGAMGRDVSGRGVQINLLKLMEETDVNLFSPTDMMSQMQAVMEMQRGGKPGPRTINTRNILFIVSGAFDKLAESIGKRLGAAGMGFGAAVQQEERPQSAFLHFAETTDFIKYGFEPEFIGRLPVRVSCDALDAGDLARILTTSEGSVLRQYRDDFRGYGIDLQVAPEAITRIAETAAVEETGARGLMTVLERVFRDFKFELPSTAIRSVEVTGGTIDDPGRALRDLLQQNAHLQKEVWEADIKRFTAAFRKRHGFHLEFSPAAIDQLVGEAAADDRTIQSLCSEKFKDYEHGLKIIERNSGQTVFKIGRLAVKDPDRELSKWVVRSIESVKGKA